MTDDDLASRPRRAKGRWRHSGDLFGLGFLLLLAACYLSPALKDGMAFSPSDLGAGLSPLTAGAVAQSTDCQPIPLPADAAATCPHDGDNGDEITQAIPWSNENWVLVHHGEWPWWNDLEGTGLPQFLNFESAPASLPSLVSYLVPLEQSFLVIVLVRLLIMGFGVYACCRLLGCRPVAAAFGGATAMLSGSFAGWLGWAIAGTLCWSGAILAAGIWVWRSPRRAAPVAALALSVAFAIYGGFPEAYVLLSGFVVAIVIGFALAQLIGRRPLSLRPLLGMAGGSLAGIGLAAPLWLPGLSVLRGSIRAGELNAHGIGLSNLALLFAQGYDGLPIAGSGYFGSPNYFESATYVGVLALVAVGVCLICAWRRSAVIGVAVGGLAAALIAYRIGTPGIVQRLVVAVGLGAIDTGRALPLLGLAIAVLGALGVEIVLARFAEPLVRRALAGSGALVGVVLVVLAARSAGGGLSPLESSLRRASLEWPVASLVLGTLLVAAVRTRLAGRPLDAAPRLGRLFAGALVCGQGAFLLFAGVGINSYATVEFPRTPATSALARAVGSSLVALDAGNAKLRVWNPALGLYPNINVGYGIDELAYHDPATPKAVFDSWPIAGAGQDAAGVNLFNPSVDSVALAKRYGASFILVAPHRPVPAATRVVAAIPVSGSADTLVAVPGSARFVFDGKPVTTVTHSGDATYVVAFAPTPVAGTLVAHVTDVAGWHASASGRALSTARGPGDGIVIAVPAGATSVSLVYRAPHLGLALGLAALSAAGLIAYVGLMALGRRRLRVAVA